MNRIFSFKTVTITLMVVWITLFVLFPNLMVAVVSLLERDADNFVKWVPTTENFRNMLDPLYLKILLKTLRYALWTTVICLLAGYPFAWIIARSSKRIRPFLLMMVIIPFWTSSLIRTYAMITILKANGLINTILRNLGLIDKPMELLYTDFAIYAGLVYALLPFMILPLYSTLEKIDKRLIEAAHDLGAGTIQVFTRVVIPISTPGIIAGSIMVFLPSMGLFYISDLLGGSKSILMGNFIKNQFLTAGNWPFGSAASILLTLLMLLFMLVYYISIKRLNINIME